MPGQVTSTSPNGRDVETAGYPMRVCELLSTLRTPAYVVRTAWRPGIELLLDDDGIWFRGWDLPPVPWRHVAEARIAGSRIRTLLYLELDDPEALFAAIDAMAGKRRAANSLVRATRLLIPNSALDAPLDEVVEAIREVRAKAVIRP